MIFSSERVDCNHQEDHRHEQDNPQAARFRRSGDSLICGEGLDEVFGFLESDTGFLTIELDSSDLLPLLHE